MHDVLSNLEVEKSIIGSALIDSEALAYIVKNIYPGDFYNTVNKKLYEIIQQLVAENKPIDLITISDRADFIELERLVEFTEIATSAGYKNHCAILKRDSIKRQFVKSAREVEEITKNGNFETLTEYKNSVLAKFDIDVGMSNNADAHKIGSIALELVGNIESRFFDENLSKLNTGFKWLDKQMGGLKAPQLTIIAARPSVGKTALSIQMAINLLQKDNHITIFNLEMGKGELAERMVCNMNGIPLDKLKNPKLLFNDDDWQIFMDAVSKLSSCKLNIYDDVFSIEAIQAIARDLKNKKQLDVLIIDYLQLMETSQKTNNANEKVTYLSRKLKMLAKEMNIPVICLSQLSRKNEADKREPKLSDLRDSGAIEQDSDNVLLLHDPDAGDYQATKDVKSTLKLIIAKQRSGQRDISANFDYYKNTQKIYDGGF